MIANNTIILYILILAVLGLGAWLIKTELRLKKIFAGKKASDLEEILVTLTEDLNQLEISFQNMTQVIELKLNFGDCE